jgi:hypothetical protein
MRAGAKSMRPEARFGEAGRRREPAPLRRGHAAGDSFDVVVPGTARITRSGGSSGPSGGDLAGAGTQPVVLDDVRGGP